MMKSSMFMKISFATVALLSLVIILVVTIVSSQKKEGNQLGSFHSGSKLGQYKRFAVSTDSNVCAPAGKEVLAAGGNAVDAAIAVMLCMGVTIPESMGLGGGCMFVLYNGTTHQAKYINAREMAPTNTHFDMFNNTEYGNPPNASYFGTLAIAVPGELAGYWHMFNNYGSGKVTWKRLFQHAIFFAEHGFSVGEHLNNALEKNKKTILERTHLKDVYVNSQTKQIFKTNEIMKQPVLAKTLKNIADASDPHDYFYKNISALLLNDIYNNSDYSYLKPVITQTDFDLYKIIEEVAHSAQLKDNITVHTSRLPGSGDLLTFMLKNMLNYTELFPDARNDQNKAILFYHRLSETFKFAFGQRMYLGDDRFDDCKEILEKLNSDEFVNYVHSKINDSQTYPSKSGYYDSNLFQLMDHGTAHLSVVDEEGNAVAATSTVNLYFGSKVMSPSTGLILNNEMDDFNTGKPNEFDIPASHANTIHPYKRPLSSMTPSIFSDESGVRLVIGASGGPHITTSVALTSLRHLYLGDNIKEAIDASRIHQQLYPDQIIYEEYFPNNIVEELNKRKNKIIMLDPEERGSIVMGISRDENGLLEANSDYRKGGTVDGE